ncbi:Hypp3994 [Branchiostoma lanceolatum]|uniref:Hypp3994 protein n=1 Tax=Branchiostoma lanceolatum TaxID=7740 RepID=A0A8K0EWM0_BRALA|nr:Hypp3994 [Branchiostoma lanceolatum]
MGARRKTPTYRGNGWDHKPNLTAQKSNGDGRFNDGGRFEKPEATSWTPARMAARDVMAAWRLNQLSGSLTRSCASDRAAFSRDSTARLHGGNPR